MNGNGQDIKTIFERYYKKTASLAERQELMDILAATGNDSAIIKEMRKAWDGIKEEDSFFSDEESKVMLQKILQTKLHRAKLFTLRRVAAAASIILAIGFGSYFLFFNKTKNEIVKTNDTVPHDVTAPKVTKALIHLADGRKVALDSLTSGTLAMQGDVKVVKNANGEIVYSGNAREIVYNTLLNPRGSKVVFLTLNDGTKVWLNSESSLKYPITFIGNERKVEITGEAYFEVAKDATKKFIVNANNKGEVEVFGTHFNVNAYDDESTIRVTLLEGSVKVNNGTASDLLKPGQQAQVGTAIKVLNVVDPDEIMAWKEGRFYFMSADMKTIMRQLERWYDVEVVLQDDISNHFTGIISRDVRVSEVFEMLQKTGTMKVKIEGKKIFISK